MRKRFAIIVDDQQGHIDHLVKHFEDIEYVDIIETFTDAKKALAFLRINEVDFIILDVELEVGMNGFRFISLMPKQIPTILYTAHEKYEDMGYEHNLVDVLLKEVTFPRLLAAVKRVDRELKELIGDDEQHTLDLWSDYFQVKGPVRYQSTMVWFKNIIYIESIGRKLKIYQVGMAEPLISNMTLSEVMERLPGNWFKQCHQSFVFNTNFFRGVIGKEVILTVVEQKLPIGNRAIYTDFVKFLDHDPVTV